MSSMCPRLAGLAAIAAIMAMGALLAPAPPGPKAEVAASANDAVRSAAYFAEAGAVLQHPRCINCHPKGDRPLQNDTQHVHKQNVVRGPDGLGAIGQRCYTCHREKNFEPAGVPGHPLWHLAPIEMAWQGRTLAEICAQIKDPTRNGGKSLEEIVHHMAEDMLVGWAWNPGPGRTPAPGTQKAFGETIRKWAQSGAHCPAT